MDIKHKQFEKVLNRILVPKINDLFSKYGDIRIVELKVISIKKGTTYHSIEHNLFTVELFLQFNQYDSGMQYFPSWIGYIIQNMLDYVFIENVHLDITNSFGEGNHTIETSYYPWQAISNEEAYRQLENELKSMYRKG